MKILTASAHKHEFGRDRRIQNAESTIQSAESRIQNPDSRFAIRDSRLRTAATNQSSNFEAAGDGGGDGGWWLVAPAHSKLTDVNYILCGLPAREPLPLPLPLERETRGDFGRGLGNGSQSCGQQQHTGKPVSQK